MTSSSNAARPPNPNVLIYGSGAVGCFLGAMLSNAGLPTTMLCRESQADELRQQGVTISRGKPETSSVAHPAIITGVEQLAAPPDIALVCIKAYDLAAALPELQHLARLRALLVTIQNGIGSEEYLLQNIPSHQLALAAAALTVSVVRDAAGKIRQSSSQGGLALAPVQSNASNPGPADRLTTLAAALGKTGLPALQLDHWQPVKWSKLLLNILGNATSAILALPPAKIYRDSRLFTVERTAFVEALVTMLGAGWFPVGLPGFNVPLLSQVMRLPPSISRRVLAGRIGGGRGDKRPSLWVDVERGQVPTEVGWLNGAVARQADQLGIAAPVNRRLAELVDELAADPSKREHFAGKPEALLRVLDM